MKKLMMALVALATAVSVQAASVAWKSSGVTFGDVSLANSTAITGYLVLLSGTSLASPYAFDASFDASKIGAVVSTDSNGGNKQGAVSETLSTVGTENGNVYAIVAKYVGSDGTYWNLSSTLNTMSGLDPDDIRVNPAAWNPFALSSTVVGESDKLTAGAGWTKAPVVPEPATGALALAGIALLFRRRKA